MRNKLKALRDRHAKLPWKELEAEAARQGCSPADISFDRAAKDAGSRKATTAQPAATCSAT